MEDVVTLDDLDSLAHDDCVPPSPFRLNISLALLLTELTVPESEAFLPAAGADDDDLLKQVRHLPSPTACRPLAYILLASRPKPKKMKTMNALPSQMYRV